MLLGDSLIREVIAREGIQVEGVLHVGAHECEELSFYQSIGVPAPRIVWVDAMADKVALAEDRGIPNVHQAVVSETDGEAVTFHVSNNGQSSSFMDLKEHKVQHPSIHYVRDFLATTVTIDTLLRTIGTDPRTLTFWNLDIQGAELKALRGGRAALAHAKIVYCEVNTKEMYEGCPLLEEVDRFLQGQGLDRVQIKMTEWGWGDALYVRRRPAPTA